MNFGKHRDTGNAIDAFNFGRLVLFIELVIFV